MSAPKPWGEQRRQRVQARAARLFPAGVGVAATVVGADLGAELFHVEHASVEGAVPSRQQEFLAGRAAVRAAQQALGLPAAPVGVGADRAPIWPDGQTGTITHAGGICIAALTTDPSVASLGIDAEEDQPLPEEVFDTVLHLHEQRWIDRCQDPGRMARLFFSAKECAYKAQYPLSRRVFGFEYITIAPDPARGTFDARFTRPVSPFSYGSVLSGRYSVHDGLIITAITVPG